MLSLEWNDPFCMNYLAHAYLSFQHPQILVGNMSSDFIKGKKQFEFSLSIQKGIQLHREIDRFTDEHPITKQVSLFFKTPYRLYAGAFTDIVYDHFLALDKEIFNTENQLRFFTQQVYAVLKNHFVQLPPTFQTILPHMIQQDWLYHYRYADGIKKSFAGLVYKAKYLTESETAFLLFNEHYSKIQDFYRDFFPQLHTFSLQKFKELLKF